MHKLENLLEIGGIKKDITLLVLSGAYCEAKRPDLRSKTVAFRF